MQKVMKSNPKAQRKTLADAQFNHMTDEQVDHVYDVFENGADKGRRTNLKNGKRLIWGKTRQTTLGRRLSFERSGVYRVRAA